MKPITLAGLGTLLVVLVALSSLPDPPAQAAPGSINLVAVDTDRTNGPPAGGNVANDIGPVDRCISIANNTDVTIDVVVDSVPAYDSGTSTGGLRGVGIDLLYDKRLVKVVGSEDGYISTPITLQYGGVPRHPLYTSDSFFDVDGRFRFDSADASTSPTSIESGEGMVAKITFRATASAISGLALLRLSDLRGETDHDPGVPRVYSADLSPYDIDNVQDGFIAVGQPCPSNLADVDGDTVANEADNCPVTRNGPAQASVPATGNQTDSDGDGFGDACEDGDRDSETPFNPHLCQGSCPGGAFRDALETVIGTNPARRCDATMAANDEAGTDAWPLDLNDDQRANTIDIGQYVPVLNDPGPARLDLNANGVVNTVDIGLFVPSLNQNCAPSFIADQFDACPGSGADPVDANGCSNLQVDGDVDGDCDPRAPSGGPAACTGSDNCPRAQNADQADTDSDGKGNACDPEGPAPNTDGVGGANDCSDGVDNDGDGQIDALDSLCTQGGDSDNDLFPDGMEVFLGTKTDDPCSDNSTANNEPLPDPWPPDFGDNQVSDSLDVGGYVSYFGGTPYTARRDLAVDGVIGMVDALVVGSYLGVNCSGF